MYIQDMKLVDLRMSKWDKEKSDPAKGDYFFTEKRYINYRGDRAAAPPFKFIWARYNPIDNFRDMRDWKTRYKASEVGLNDPYWPEGVAPQNGKYIEGDAILMKVPILEYARKRKAEIAASDSRPDAIKKQFMSEAAGMGLGVSEEELDKMLAGRM